MDQDRIIAEVARRNGVLLTRDDPILQINTMLDLHAADHQEREARLAQRDADLLAAVKKLATVLADKQALDVAELTKAAAAGAAEAITGEAVYSIDRLVLQRYRRLVLLAALVLVLGIGAGLGVGYWLRGGAPTAQCAAQNGGVACWYWLAPPTQPEGTARGK
jgi:hypothetical protein